MTKDSANFICQDAFIALDMILVQQYEASSPLLLPMHYIQKSSRTNMKTLWLILVLPLARALLMLADRTSPSVYKGGQAVEIQV
jgi:hypothetical protein